MKRPAQAKRLAAMASSPEITYTPNGQYDKVGAVLWYGMIALSRDGRTWDYWLAPDWGSYRGGFSDEQLAAMKG